MFALRYVEVPAAQLGSGLSAADLVVAAVAEQHGERVDVLDAAVLPRLHAAIAGGTATVAIRDARIVAVWPGFVDEAYGVAVDVGSTTIAGHLCALFGGEVRGERRPDEPADPLRRGPDEPRVLRDDEPRR